MIKGAVIQLTDEQYQDAIALGKARYTNNREHGVLKTHIHGVDPVQADVEGVAGEIAFAQLVNADTSEIKRIGVTSSEQGTDAGDVIHAGLCIDVKTTKYEGGHLLVYAHKLDNPNIDGYVLMTGYRGRYTCRGYISKEAIKVGIETDRFKMQSRNTYWINQNDLGDINSD